MDVGKAFEHGNHIIVVFGPMRAHPWSLQLVRFGVEVKGLVLMPDDIEIERFPGSWIFVRHSAYDSL